MALLYLLQPIRCEWFVERQGWSSLLLSIVSQGILQLRVFAMYRDNKIFLRFMISLFAICSAGSCAVMGLYLHSFSAIAVPLPRGHFCALTNVRFKGFFLIYVFVLVFETFLCVSAVIWAAESRYLVRRPCLHSGYKRLADVLFRDSVIYFIGIFTTNLVSLLLTQLAPHELDEASLGFILSFICVMTSRLILNLRRTATVEPEGTSGTSLDFLNDFADTTQNDEHA
ncbi:hypothetical protein CPC08DRAFT_47509 [Agrocybe pediades]|nr:hypothetical protein CPC08DRAFT_47509 [Agrocybe pediades]